MTDSQVWVEALTRMGVKPETAQKWAPAFAVACTPSAFTRGVEEMDDFLGQVLHESNKLEHMEENLNYSAERLMAVWPKRFPDLEMAQAFAHNPKAIANHVYANRMGNLQPDDGWRYRGRGPIMITGHDGYAAAGAAIGEDLVSNPDLMLEPRVALAATMAWWEGNVPDDIIGNVKLVTRRVNGGTLGLDERERLTNVARAALDSSFA